MPKFILTPQPRHPSWPGRPDRPERAKPSRPGTWPWALAPWPGPGPHSICTLGGWDLALGLGPLARPWAKFLQICTNSRQPACGSQQNFAKNRASRPDFLQNSAVHHFFVALADENRPGSPRSAFVGTEKRLGLISFAIADLGPGPGPGLGPLVRLWAS